MQIEYQITFRADGVTVAQNIQPDGDAGQQVGRSLESVESAISLPGQPDLLTDPGGGGTDKPMPGGGGIDKPMPGGGGTDKPMPGGGAGLPSVVFSCPIVITCFGGVNDGRRTR